MNGCIYRSQFDMCEKSKEEDEKRGIRRWCDFDGCEDKHPSNADRIRSMTDEELADWLGIYCNGQTAQEVGKPCVSDMGSCEECWLDWLKQEET